MKDRIEETIHAQIVNGTIDPNWVIACILALAVFLLVRILNRIEKKQEAHDEKLSDHGERIAVLENQPKKK